MRPNAQQDPDHDCRMHQNENPHGDRFWMVMANRRDQAAPVIKFCDRTFAVREAERLATLNPRQGFYTLCATGLSYYDPQPSGITRLLTKRGQS